jgi:SAM-dependent methyltransferase
LSPPSARKSPDPYRSLETLIPWLEWVPEIFLRSVRRDTAGLLERMGLKRVLDLGCGTGAFSRRAAAVGLSPVCLDPSSSLLARAARRACGRNPFLILRADGRRLPLGAGFDAVVISLALHEMDRGTREEVWKEAGRVLRPGGLRILIDYAVPERRSGLSSLYGKAAGWIEKQMEGVHPPHYFNYREFMENGGVKDWALRCGGTILEERRYGGGNLALLAVRGGEKGKPPLFPAEEVNPEAPGAPPGLQIVSAMIQ